MTEQEVRRFLRQMHEKDSERAFKGFYDLTYDRLFRIAYYYLHREEWAQEVVLDVFMKLWEQRHSLPALQSIEDYCFILVKNASLNYLEKETRKQALFVSEESVQTTQQPHLSENSPEEFLISEELFARYVKALDRLPRRCREVFIRIREEGKSYAQVGKELHISPKTVDAQLQKATERLKKSLFNEPDPGTH